jgi:hypothetical protein
VFFAYADNYRQAVRAGGGAVGQTSSRCQLCPRLLLPVWLQGNTQYERSICRVYNQLRYDKLQLKVISSSVLKSIDRKLSESKGLVTQATFLIT